MTRTERTGLEEETKSFKETKSDAAENKPTGLCLLRTENAVNRTLLILQKRGHVA